MPDGSIVPVLARLARAFQDFYGTIRHYQRASCACPSCQRYGHHHTNSGERAVARAARGLSAALADYEAAGGRAAVDAEIARTVHQVRRKFDELIGRWGWRSVIGPDWKTDHRERRHRFYRDVERPFLEAVVSWRDDLDLPRNAFAAAWAQKAARRGIQPTRCSEEAAGIAGPLWELLQIESRWGDSLPLCDSEDLAVFEDSARFIEGVLPVPAPSGEAPEPQAAANGRNAPEPAEPVDPPLSLFGFTPDIEPLLRRIWDARPRPVDLTADELDRLTAYLATRPPLPPSCPTLALGSFSAEESRGFPASIPNPVGTERWWRQHLEYVRLTNERRLAGPPPTPDVGGGVKPPSPTKPSDQSFISLLRVYANGVVEDRISQAAALLGDDKLTVNDKLVKIDALIPIPPTASAERLGELLGVSKQAVLKTDWWIQKRRGEKQDEIGRRRAGYQERARGYEAPGLDEDDE
jgi:hypothetical protein